MATTQGQKGANHDPIAGAEGGRGSTDDAGEASRRLRAAQRRTWILTAAKAVFLKQGYAGASMDEIAAAAAVSKVTIYKYFHSKEGLFAELVQDLASAVLEPLTEEQASGLEEALQNVGERTLIQALAPDTVALIRLCIAEARRLPELSRSVDDAGHVKVLDHLSAFLDEQVKQGYLKACDTHLAAEQFFGLVLGFAQTRALLGQRPPLSDEDRRRLVANAVATFLDRYASDRSASTRRPRA